MLERAGGIMIIERAGSMLEHVLGTLGHAGSTLGGCWERTGACWEHAGKTLERVGGMVKHALGMLGACSNIPEVAACWGACSERARSMLRDAGSVLGAW